MARSVVKSRLKWFHMAPYGHILFGSEATWVTKAPVWLIRIWHEISYPNMCLTLVLHIFYRGSRGIFLKVYLFLHPQLSFLSAFCSKAPAGRCTQGTMIFFFGILCFCVLFNLVFFVFSISCFSQFHIQ